MEAPPEATPPQPLRRRTIALWLLFAAWLPAGFVFRPHIRDFGWGFLPFIGWFYSFPFVALTAGIAFLFARRGGDASAPRRARGWLILALVYLLVTVAWHSIPQLREWVLTGKWALVE